MSRGAAPGRVQPQHQGAGRLLGGAVHGRRRAAGPGREHPGAPRLDAGVGARPPSPASAPDGDDASVPASRSSSTTPSPGAPTSTTSPWWRPCFVEADGRPRLLGWVATRAHHADVGGAAPGSLPADAVEIFAEGLRIPPVRLTPEVRALLLANSRTPDERAGDLDAQVGANVVGVERLAGVRRRAAGRGARLRRAAHAGGAAGPARRPVDVLRRDRQLRSRARPAGRDGHRGGGDHRRRRHHVRLHRHRAPAGRQRQRGRGGHRQRGGLRPAGGAPTRPFRPTAARSARSR